MARLIGWILAPFYMFFFALIFGLFHPIQVLALRLGGYYFHKRSIDLIDLFLLLNLRLAGARITITSEAEIPLDRPLVVLSNHQSLYDIPLLGWTFRRHHPKYVSKKELGKWLPSVSYNLRHGGSVLIDRSNPRQAVAALAQFGRYLEEHRYAGCIFPEGTRGRDGRMKPFKSAGAATILKHSPSALVVPVAIDGSWQLARYGFVPIPFGVKLRCTVLSPIEPKGRPAEELVRLAEDQIRAVLNPV